MENIHIDLERQLNISHDELMSDINGMFLNDKIEAAACYVENYIGRPLSGFDDPIPEPLREAIRLLAASYYENREAVLVGLTAAPLPYGVIDLIEPYRVWRFK